MNRKSGGRQRLLLVFGLGLSLLVMGVAGATVLKRTAVSLPKIPSFQDKHPELYDKNGCLLTEEGPKCGPKTSPKGPDSEQKFHVLMGFKGKYYAPEVADDGVKMLTETVAVDGDQHWQAWGLVRNEYLHDVGHVNVTAVLYGQDNTVLTKASGVVLVESLRPGEPGPFKIAAEVPAKSVARVEWTVTPGAADQTISRNFEIIQDALIDYGATAFKGQQRQGPDYPYLLSVSLKNLGRPLHNVKDVKLVVAWLNQSGKVIWVAETPIMPDFTAIDTGRGAIFQPIEVNDPIIGTQLNAATPIYWVVGA